MVKIKKIKRSVKDFRGDMSQTERIIRGVLGGSPLHKIGHSNLAVIPAAFLKDAGEEIEGRYYVAIEMGTKPGTLIFRAITMDDVNKAIAIISPGAGEIQAIEGDYDRQDKKNNTK